MLTLLRRSAKLASQLQFRTRLHDTLRCRSAKRGANSTAHPQIKSANADYNAAVIEPTHHQLYAVALHQAIPFVGFGIMDNAILILAGEAIDVYLGAALGLSTMCAAAIGNIISNWVGVENSSQFCLVMPYSNVSQPLSRVVLDWVAYLKVPCKIRLQR